MSTLTDDDSGIDLLLFVALQVSTEWTSSRPKFCITISLRVTPLRSALLLLLTNLSLRYQDTIGAGLPAEIHQFRLTRRTCVNLAEKKLSEARLFPSYRLAPAREYLRRPSTYFDDILRGDSFWSRCAPGF